MTTRILPPEEWHRLIDMELSPIVAHLDPAQTSIVVLERDGAIIATWAVMTVQHLEGAWIHPSYRGNPSVMRRILGATFRVLQGLGATYAWTGARTDEVRALIGKLQGHRMDMDCYVIPVPKGSS